MKFINTFFNDLVTITAIIGLVIMGLEGVATGETLILAIAGLGGYRIHNGA